MRLELTIKEELKELPNLLTQIDTTVDALQKAPTAGEWHKRFAECVSSLRDVKDKLLEKMKEFNE